MSASVQTSLEKITFPVEYLEDWSGREYLFHKMKGVYTSDDLIFRVELDHMLSDGLSVPQQFRDRIERMGRRLVAGLHHDTLYAGEIFPRKLADWIFLEILDYKDSVDRRKNPDVAPSRLWGWIVRNGAWLGVRAGGGAVWRRHKKNEVIAFRKCLKITVLEAAPKLRTRIKLHELKMKEKGYPGVITWSC